MKSLFAKILAWFLFATLLTGLVTAAVHALSRGGWPPERLIESVLRPHIDAAIEQHRAFGHEGLVRHLTSVRQLTGAPLRIVDSEGRDLETGELLPPLEGRRFGPPPLIIESSDGSARGVVRPNRGFVFAALLRPANLVTFSLVALLCWGLARHISRPIDELRTAVDRFGEGETGLRVDSSRKDEVGDLARSFDRMAGRIDGLLTSQRQLLLDISHELRSPLTRLNLATELLRKDPGDEQCLSQIETESHRLNELISQLLLAGRLEAQTQGLRRESVRLDDLLAEIVAAVELEARSANRSVKLTASEPVRIEAERELIRRAIENVVRNGLRHTPERVEVELAVADDQARMVVRDFGPGVQPEALERLFDPFYRVQEDRDRSTGGAGLGLTIARRAVEAHGGTIAARNRSPGLEVSITLPA